MFTSKQVRPPLIDFFESLVNPRETQINWSGVMKFFNILCSGAASFCLISSVMAQSLPESTVDEIVVQGDAATSAEVFPVSPGVAMIEIGPLYGVFLESVPLGSVVHMSEKDVSGKGTAHVAKLKKTPYRSALICWKEVGPRWNEIPSCGEVDGSRSTATINLGNRRSEVFALVPVALDSKTQAHLAWIAHPENTQVQIHCGGSENMASIFAIDAKGDITIANESERARYQAQYCK